MKKYMKAVVGSVALLLVNGSVLANEIEITKDQIEAQIKMYLTNAISELPQSNIQKDVRVDLDHMAFRQNLGQFLYIVKYNEETKTVSPKLESE